MTRSNGFGTLLNQQHLARPLLAALAFAAAFSPAALPAASGKKPALSQTTKPKVMPTFEAVKAAVEAQLKKKTHYKPGDMLSRSDVDPIFGKLGGLGWKVDDQKAILDQLLPDDYYLVRALRSPDNNL